MYKNCSFNVRQSSFLNFKRFIHIVSFEKTASKVRRPVGTVTDSPSLRDVFDLPFIGKDGSNRELIRSAICGR